MVRPRLRLFYTPLVLTCSYSRAGLTPACFNKSNISFFARALSFILYSSRPTRPHLPHQPPPLSTSHSRASVSYALTLTHFWLPLLFSHNNDAARKPTAACPGRSAANLAVKVLTLLLSTLTFDSNGDCRSPGLQDRSSNEQ